MSLDELNRRLTNAIIRAESLPAGSRDAWEAFHEVSALEESIATLVPPDDIEGEIARLGAVAAALSAGEPLCALQLAERFLAESLAPEVAEKLRRLVKEADAELARAVTDEPTVMPVTFTLRAA
jgi:pyruvate-formate lyase-activating enzyme